MDDSPVSWVTGAEDLARLAMAVQSKMRTGDAGLDPAHLDELLAKMPRSRCDAPATRHDGLWLSCVIELWGGLPPLGALVLPLAQVALLSRERLLASLCTLALARRPGLVRGLIEKSARHAVRTAVGPAWPALQLLSSMGRGTGLPQVGVEPAPLAWAGYEDWKAAIGSAPVQLQRMVWLSLPPSGMAAGTQLASMAAPIWPCDEALEQLNRAGAAWPY